MSLAIYPVFDGATELGSFDGGELLALNVDRLDEIASERMLKMLSEFANNPDVPDDFDGDPWEFLDSLNLADIWFDARDGSQAVLELRKCLLSDARALTRLDNGQDMMDELERLAGILQRASEVGLRFRLEMS